MAETVALVGSETLMGREMRDLFAGSETGRDVRLIAGSEEDEPGKLTVQGDEPSFIAALNAVSLDGAAAIVVAGSPETAKQVIALKPSAPIIDLTHGTEDLPGARLRAPMVEPHDYRVPPDAIHTIAHPAAIAIAVALGSIHQEFPVMRSVILIFEPASERGMKGVDELQQQTVSLLSFKSLPKKVFDNQLSFSMLAALGEDAVIQLKDVESRIERHLTTLLSISSKAPIPSLRLIQAPVFHGYSFSFWIEFASNPGVTVLEKILKSDSIDVRPDNEEPPNNIGAAGQKGVAIGAISVDDNHPHAMWLWMAADNLRLAAENAVLVAREVM